MLRLFACFAGILVLSLAFSPAGTAQEADSLSSEAPPPGDGRPDSAVPTAPDTTEKDAPYVATDQRVVERMLEVADVIEGDVVYDLGSGDGRIPITAAAKHGARGVGIEIDPELVDQSRTRAEAAGVSGRVEFRQQDMFEADVSDATVVALYLWPEITTRLGAKLLRQLGPGDRIVSHDFRIEGWKPTRIVDAGEDKTGTATIYLWVVPETIPDRLIRSLEAREGTP